MSMFYQGVYWAQRGHVIIVIWILLRYLSMIGQSQMIEMPTIF